MDSPGAVSSETPEAWAMAATATVAAAAARPATVPVPVRHSFGCRVEDWGWAGAVETSVGA